MTAPSSPAPASAPSPTVNPPSAVVADTDAEPGAYETSPRVGGAVWGRATERNAPFHRLASVAFGPQTATCGTVVNVVGIHHCDPQAGEDAQPCVGTVCEWCAARRHRVYQDGDRVQIVDEVDDACGVVTGTAGLRLNVRWDDGVESAHPPTWLKVAPNNAVRS